MESFGGAGLSPGACIVRKKRSIVSHKPRLDPPTFSPSSFGKRNTDEKQNSETVVISDGLRSENMPKKLKLTFGGVTHTIHTKCTENFGFGGRSSITKSSSSTHQLNPLPQDDVGGGHLSSDGRNGFVVTRKYHPKFDSGSRKEYSLKEKILKETSPMDNEPVRKSKRLPKTRSVLDVGFNEDDDEDEEIRFLAKLNASKVTRSERIQMHDGFHGNDTGEYNQSKLGKHSRKNSRSEKLYEDKDYLEEDEELTSESDDVPESNGKKQKKGSLLLLEGWNESTPTTRNRALQSGKDILTGSGSGFLDFANDLLPASSKRKKEKISEVDRQLKKAEAAQKRKVHLEKAAMEAEAEAIRKILGQDSKKKKEEKLKQQRDELIQGRISSDVTLAPNTVRWIIGPNGTIVTFSDDVGLPDIFSPVPCSYPPPREKCAGPNCTNAYKYRDSKSKLPLCSLHCYKAINEKTQPLIAC